MDNNLNLVSKKEYITNIIFKQFSYDIYLRKLFLCIENYYNN